mmetsp:Transcript_69979/g.195773  ORF Transcript_69979/g.195773 Transcript_69979/m.195773 type:complete len:347 (-) Transcript_69979:825-1865(-)
MLSSASSRRRALSRSSSVRCFSVIQSFSSSSFWVRRISAACASRFLFFVRWSVFSSERSAIIFFSSRTSSFSPSSLDLAARSFSFRAFSRAVSLALASSAADFFPVSSCFRMSRISCGAFANGRSLPCPSWPHRDDPHVKQRPSWSRAMLWSPPLATKQTRPSSSGMLMGSTLDAVLPRPSFPCAPAPNASTFPLSVRTKLCRFPAQTWTTTSSDSETTTSGDQRSPLSPCPSCPSWPKPKLRTCTKPDWSRAITSEWAEPPAASSTWKPSKPPTRCGSSTSLSWPRPVAPQNPFPNEKSSPFFMTTSEWSAPAATELASPNSRASMHLGVSSFCFDPCPSCPLEP